MEDGLGSCLYIYDSDVRSCFSSLERELMKLSLLAFGIATSTYTLCMYVSANFVTESTSAFVRVSTDGQVAKLQDECGTLYKVVAGDSESLRSNWPSISGFL